MLSRVFIRNIVLIKECEVNLAEGLTVITGETGAGKSMFMDALGLAIGHKAEAGFIRHDATEAMVEATFSVPQEAQTLRTLLTDEGIELEDDELILRRLLSKEGKSRAFANGMRLTQAQCQSIGERLVDIHGQHAHQMLLKASRHAEMLDRFGNLHEERAQVRQAYHTWQHWLKELEKLRQNDRDRAYQKDLLTSYISELEDVHYNTGEEEHLTSEWRRLQNGEQVQQALAAMTELFESEIAPDAQLSRAARQLDDLRLEDEAFTTFKQRLESLVLELRELAADAPLLSERYAPDPAMLAQVDNRLNILRELARKHKVEISALSHVMADYRTELANLDNQAEQEDEYADNVTQARNQFEQAVTKLSQRRQLVADALQKSLQGALKPLKLETVQFEVALENLDVSAWGAAGGERVQFLISLNPGQPLQPLDKVVSGGEASRLMLALKQIFFAKMPEMTLVFDEVDTGIGGVVAEAVGQSLKKLASKHQVLAITHLPQVAAQGNAHFKIDKMTDGQNTRTTIAQLDESQRSAEVARMLSGRTVTEAAKEAARRLIQSATAPSKRA